MQNESPHLTNSTVHDLATQCETVLQLSNALEPNIREIAERTQEIPPLSEAVLETVNSASLGLQKTVRSIDQAVALLGARRMCDVIEGMLDHSHGAQTRRRVPGELPLDSKRTA